MLLLEKLMIIFFIGIFFFFFFLMYKWNKSNLISEHEIFVKDLPISIQDQEILWITNPMNIARVNEMKSKFSNSNIIVVIAGNLTRYHNKLEKLSECIQILTDIGPVHYIWNDQDYNGKFREINAFLLDNRVTILENTAANYESSDGNRFSIVGLDDVVNHRDQLNLAVQDSQKDSYQIVISYDEIRETDTSFFKSIPLYLFQQGDNQSIRNSMTNYIEIDELTQSRSKNQLGYILKIKRA
ncbi:hypothetical protein J5Y03_03420 [Bacillus sp. RG28]|uniref:Uncharacterized protein n=1 Tax=Gottfriedia endophytica TaxID=2820819 RepID=A0A940SFQ1_9BACI|nr:hypothetical protein [Gottfriedia endophytica]MBP0724232.1 hypothetical protein [Gottfriedia endophytica]